MNLGQFRSLKCLLLSASHLVENENRCDMTATMSGQCIAVRRAACWMQTRYLVTISLLPVLSHHLGGEVWSEELMAALRQTMRTGPVTDRNVPKCADQVITASSLIPSAPPMLLTSFASHRKVSAPSSPQAQSTLPKLVCKSTTFSSFKSLLKHTSLTAPFWNLLTANVVGSEEHGSSQQVLCPFLIGMCICI